MNQAYLSLVQFPYFCGFYDHEQKTKKDKFMFYFNIILQ